MSGRVMRAAECNTIRNRRSFAWHAQPASSSTRRWAPRKSLKFVQERLRTGDPRAQQIFDTIGCYVGCGVAQYVDFYELRHVLILGRVTSGEEGSIILSRAQEVLKREFPELAAKISLHLPDESSRRVGQAVAAASLPALK